MAQAEGCLCIWCLADIARTVTFSSVLHCTVFTIVRADMCLFLTGKLSLLPEAMEGRLYGAGLQQERKGSFPKGVK